MGGIAKDPLKGRKDVGESARCPDHSFLTHGIADNGGSRLEGGGYIRAAAATTTIRELLFCHGQGSTVLIDDPTGGWQQLRFASCSAATYMAQQSPVVCSVRHERATGSDGGLLDAALPLK